MTNRDIYLAIERLCKRKKGTAVTLEAWLTSLRARLPGREPLTPQAFLELLEAAFEPAEAGKTGTAPPDVLQRLDAQVTDLQDMARSGQLDDQFRYFGINAPSGRRWYNFDPLTFVECGVVGAMGGWEDGDDTDREYVPGEVAVLGGGSVDPREIEHEVEQIEVIEWSLFRMFLGCGQTYE
ncbi:MAG TPA: hypothetical protein VGO93_25690 [Candidatus Xenobia bacterium]|jgi:hypothetical protein